MNQKYKNKNKNSLKKRKKQKNNISKNSNQMTYSNNMKVKANPYLKKIKSKIITIFRFIVTIT